MHVKLDVALCVFNDEKNIEVCLQSIQQQKGINKIFVLNDASTDGTNEKIQKFLTDKRIIYIQKKQNKGLATGLNEILEKSDADFIVRHDADDIMLRERIVIQKAILSSNPAIDILSGGARFRKSNSYVNRSITMDDQKIKFALKKRNPIVHPTVVLRRSSILNIGGYNQTLKRAQDYELWLRAANNNLTFYQDHRLVIEYKYQVKSWNNILNEIKALSVIAKKYGTYLMLIKSMFYLLFGSKK
jgi:glycosyltransferase involved in cell wall biosynthesis